MKITCESCGAKYTIADDKVRGRKVKIRCKGCGTPIVVDGQQSMPPNGESSGEPESGVPLDVPAATGDAEWSVNLSDTEQTTLTTQQVVDGWQNGRITADAFVWKEGMDDWVAIQESAELSPLLKGPGGARASADGNGAATKPSLGSAGAGAAKPTITESSGGGAPSNTASSAAKSAAAARLAGGRAKASTDLFAGVERAGADEEEVATSAPPVLPKAGLTAQQDDSKLTGARNENSVLFSLDALKAGFSGAPAKAPEPAPVKARGQKADDPFDLGAPSSVAGIGGGSNALFSLADNQALLTAPAPPEPPPRVVQASLPAGSLPPDPAARKKTLLLAAGAGVGVLAIGLALGASMSGGQSSAAAPSVAPAVEQPASGDKTAAKADEAKTDEAEKKPEPAGEAPKEEPKAEAKTDAKTDAPAGEAKTVSKTDDKPSAGETSKADKPASGSTPSSTARKEASKEPTAEAKPAAPSGGAEFSKSAAIGALGAASAQAASCKKIGGPTGSGKVNVTFAPSGRVTSANVNGAPFAGTSVGGCVASVFRKAKVPSFSGSPVTVSKSFTIR